MPISTGPLQTGSMREYGAYSTPTSQDDRDAKTKELTNPSRPGTPLKDRTMAAKGQNKPTEKVKSHGQGKVSKRGVKGHKGPRTALARYLGKPAHYHTT